MNEKFEQSKYAPAFLKGYIRKNDKLKIIKNEADCVQLCFSSYIKTENLSETARILNSAGYRGKRGKKFSANSVKVILKNKTYAGYVCFKKEEKSGMHECIISAETFSKVQNILKRRKRI